MRVLDQEQQQQQQQRGQQKQSLLILSRKQRVVQVVHAPTHAVIGYARITCWQNTTGVAADSSSRCSCL
jgi:hypothetical protein